MDAPPQNCEIKATLVVVRGQRRSWRALWPELSLLLIAAATRLPLLSAVQGEPDTARFTVAVWQWLQFGPHAPASHTTYGYYHVLAPGYFAVWRWLAAWLPVSASNLSLSLNTLSVLTALLTAPLLYRIGARFLAPKTAWIAAVLFLLAPGFWWLGLEAHPQGPALLLMLVALDQFVVLHVRRRPLYGAFAAAAFAAALLMRGDSVLLAPAFPVVPGFPTATPALGGPPAGCCPNWLRCSPPLG